MQSCYLRTSLALHHLYLRRCFPLPGFPRAVTCPGSLGSSSLGQFLLLSLSWLNLMFLKHDFVATLVAQMVKDLSAMQETRVHSLGREDPLEKDMATTLVFLPGESHGQKSLAGYMNKTDPSPWGRKELDTSEQLPCARARTNTHTHTHTHTVILQLAPPFGCVGCFLMHRLRLLIIRKNNPFSPCWWPVLLSASCWECTLSINLTTPDEIVVICLRWSLLDLPIIKSLLSLCD